MSMKVKDLMLDINTGDASFDDARVQADLGAVKTACEAFDICKTIYEADEEISDIVLQEAFGGFWNSREKTDDRKADQKSAANEAGCTQVLSAVDAYYKLAKDTAKTVCENAKKNTNLIKTLAQKGLTSADTFEDQRCLTGKAAKDLAKQYTYGMANLVTAFGYSIDSVFSKAEVSKVIGREKGIRDTVESIEDVEKYLNRASEEFRKCKKAPATTKKITKTDAEEIGDAFACISVVSTEVNRVLKAGGVKSTKDMIKSICAATDTDSKKRSKATSINQIMKDMVYQTAALNLMSKAIVTGFNNSAAAINNAVKMKK